MDIEDRDDKVQQLRSAVSLWRRLDKVGKQKSLRALKLQLAEATESDSDGEPDDLEETDGNTNTTTSQEGAPDTTSRIEADSDSVDESAVEHLKIYENVHLTSSSSYLYYYPTMHWSMDKTPDSEDYWIGIYERGAPDDKYLAHHWIGMVAKGSFRVGKLETTAGKVGTNRTDVFELRMFNGSQRCVQAKTNYLVGSVLCTAVNPYSGKSLKTEEELSAKALEVSETDSYIQQAFDESDEETKEAAEDQRDGGFMDKLKNAFSFHEKGKLVHRFEQEFLSDEITKREDSVDRPEPKDEYSDLGKSTTSSKQPPTAADTPSGIVLEISLNYSNIYVYPMLHTTAATKQKKAWFGVYKASSNGDMKFDYKSGSLGSNKRLLRSSSAGETQLDTLSEWSNTKPCTLDNRYVGVIFDVKPGHKKYSQVGLAATMIRASMYMTPAPDSSEFKPNFDVKLAKTCASLSAISYESDYDALKKKVAELKLTTEMKIYDFVTDTDGFIASDSTTTLVVFRGTGTNKMQWTFTDMVTNFLFIPEPILPNSDSPKGHRGFVNSLNSVYDKIFAHLKPYFGKKRLIFTGHSLGASLASLFVYRLTTDYEELKSSVTLMTFACPPTGSKEFREHFKDIDSSSITIQGDFFSSGWLIKRAKVVVEFYRPVSEKFLPFTGGHSIKGYVEQIDSLSED